MSKYRSVEQAVQELVIARTDGYATIATMDPDRLLRHAARAMPTERKRTDPSPVTQAVRLADVEQAVVQAFGRIVAPEGAAIVAGVALARLGGWSVERTAMRFALTASRVQNITRSAREKLRQELAERGLMMEYYDGF